MRQVAKSTDRRIRHPEQARVGDEPARFLRNLTSLPDADFATTYSPAIAAVFASYADRPDPAAARRALLRALKAALKRRRAFILPRFTQAEDSWRIRECASYAVAIAILVEHAYAVRAPDRNDQPAVLDIWPQILADPEAAAEPGEAGLRAAIFDDIVPAEGRRWIAREPLVQALIGNYFTDTAPNELQDIVGPVVAEFGHDHQVPRHTRKNDLQPSLQDVPDPRPTPSEPENRSWFLMRALAKVHAALRLDRPLRATPEPDRDTEPNVSAAQPPPHRRVASPDSPSIEQHRDATRHPEAVSSSDTPAIPESTPSPNRPVSSPVPAASRVIRTRRPRATKPSRHRRGRTPVAGILHGLPVAPAPLAAAPPKSPAQAAARRPDIGDHGAATARIGHAADYVGGLMAENGIRPTQQPKPFLLPGPAPEVIGRPLDIDALFPASADPTRIDLDAIAAWVAFRDRLVDALRTGEQSANRERSLVHMLDVGVFLVWPQVVLPYGDELRLSPQAIKSAMRAAGVLAVNRADQQDDRHAFPSHTGSPRVTCHGLVTLPEYLWPDASLGPAEPSAFVRPPAIYGQRYRRPR